LKWHFHKRPWISGRPLHRTCAPSSRPTVRDEQFRLHSVERCAVFQVTSPRWRRVGLRLRNGQSWRRRYPRPKNAFFALPPVHRADLERQQGAIADRFRQFHAGTSSQNGWSNKDIRSSPASSRRCRRELPAVDQRARCVNFLGDSERCTPRRCTGFSQSTDLLGSAQLDYVRDCGVAWPDAGCGRMASTVRIGARAKGFPGG
jgi:hypothetical protein